MLLKGRKWKDGGRKEKKGKKKERGIEEGRQGEKWEKDEKGSYRWWVPQFRNPSYAATIDNNAVPAFCVWRKSSFWRHREMT